MPLCGVIQDWLTYEDYAVEVSHAGVDCWQRLQDRQYDLVILDWDLPYLNGIDILRRYHESGGTAPVIMLTGKTSVEHRVQGLDTGASDYLPKPFHMKELCARANGIEKPRPGAQIGAQAAGVRQQEGASHGHDSGSTVQVSRNFG